MVIWYTHTHTHTLYIVNQCTSIKNIYICQKKKKKHSNHLQINYVSFQEHSQKQYHRIILAWIPAPLPHKHTANSSHLPNDQFDACQWTSGNTVLYLWKHILILTHLPHLFVLLGIMLNCPLICHPPSTPSDQWCLHMKPHCSFFFLSWSFFF